MILVHRRFDRRRNHRVDLLAKLQGRMVKLDEDVVVFDLSLAGMTIVTQVPLSLNMSHEFHLQSDMGRFFLMGRIVHCYGRVEGDTFVYESGVDFYDLDSATLEALKHLVDQNRLDSLRVC